MSGRGLSAVVKLALSPSGSISAPVVLQTSFLARVRAALAFEAEQRRFFLWLPVALGTGVALYFSAAHEPSLLLTSGGAVCALVCALVVRQHRRLALALIALAAVCAGMAVAGGRSAMLAAPVIDRMRIASLQGYIEEADFRREGARLVLRVVASDVFSSAEMPYRVRLTTRRTPPFDAGTYVDLKARLLPPSRAAAPSAYDFARDAFFMQIGAVGSVLGRIDEAVAPEPPGWSLSFNMAVDRARNGLARRVATAIGGDAGAIAAAMVTGKRDLLSDDARSLIREAGIFHVITISGVQMTLVAGLFFVGFRRLLATSRTLALHYPIKKWAAAAAIVGAVAYDVLTGSRIGTQRALIMTMIMLGAVLLDRRALTMRNLAVAALVVLVTQPEALLGASFQLSFAAVAALIAVHEMRSDARSKDVPALARHRSRSWLDPALAWLAQRRRGLAAALATTACATMATAAFMAYDFHELNPYVLVGNPLTLAIIEFFAVPAALCGTLLSPFGLDGLVWHWLGFGISLIMWAARLIGSWPGSSLHVPSFAPWALPPLALAVLSVVIWRTTLMRLTAVPFAVIGLAGAVHGASFDVAIPASGDAAAIRGADGRLSILGNRPSLFDAEQWLRSDADGRAARQAIRKNNCDELGCTGRLPDGRALSVVRDEAAFAEDCQRATVIVTPLIAPVGCGAPLIFDRLKLRGSGATTLKLAGRDLLIQTTRGEGDARPWSPSSRPAPPRWSATHHDDDNDGGSVATDEPD